MRAFLGELIDDAGLFPPAQLSMEDALAAHARAEASEPYWMLGRFIVPASRLDELYSALDDAPEALPTSVVLDGDDPSAALAELVRANARADRIAIEACEAKAELFSRTSANAVEAFVGMSDAAGVPPEIVRYLEIAPNDDGGQGLGAVRSVRDAGHALCAKVRCGGLTADAVPDAASLAAFIAATKTYGVPFKATAGLHHPITHDNAAVGFRMHGFLNVIGAAVLVHAGLLAADRVEAMLRDDVSEHFRLDATAFAWTGGTAASIAGATADAAAIGAARAFVHSYGSCSFDEPVDDLCELGILGGASPA